MAHKSHIRDATRARILAVALDLAGKIGYQFVTRQAVAEHTGLAPATISFHFNTMPQLKRAIMRAAIQAENLRVVAQGLTARDPQAMRAPEAMRRAAADSLRG